MSDSAVKTESLLKRMQKNLSQDIPIAVSLKFSDIYIYK